MCTAKHHSAVIFVLLVAGAVGVTPSPSCVSIPAGPNLVYDPSFEIGAAVGNCAGWSCAGGGGCGYTMDDNYYPKSGSYAANFNNCGNGAGCSNKGYFQQTISGLTVGKLHTVSFWAAGSNGGVMNQFNVLIGGVTIVSLTGGMPGGWGSPTNWFQFSYTFTPSTTSALLRFEECDQNSGVLLDLVSVTIVPVDCSNSPTPSVTMTPTASRTPTCTPTRSVTPSVSLSVTPTVTPTRTASPSVTPTSSVSPSLTPTSSISLTNTATASISMSFSSTNSATRTSTTSPSDTASSTETATASTTPSSSESPSLSSTTTISETNTPSSTETMTPTTSPTSAASATMSRSLTSTGSISQSKTGSISRTPSSTETATRTATGSRSLSSSTTTTATASTSLSKTMTPSTSSSPSSSPSSSSSPTMGPSTTSSASPSLSRTPSVSPSLTRTSSPSSSTTPSVTGSVSMSASATASASFSATASTSGSVTPSISVSPSTTPTPSTSTLCSAACDPVPVPVCTGPLADACTQCNEVMGYTRDINGVFCVLLPCPAGQFEDASVAGAHHCALFRINIQCVGGTSCYTAKDGSISSQILVTLSNMPSADVTITVVSSDTTKGVVTVTSVTLTTATWQTGVVVTVNGVDDNMITGDTMYSVTFGSVTSADTRYQPAPSVSIQITSVDTHSTSTALQGSVFPAFTSEDGSTALLSLRLTFAPGPGNNVLVTCGPSNPAIASLAPATVTFSSSFQGPVQMTLTGLHDLVAEGNITYTVDCIPANPAYAPLSIPVGNRDIDTAGVLSSKSLLLVNKMGSTDTVSVTLRSEPLADVILATTTSVAQEASVTSGAQLVFTPTNYNVPQDIVVTGGAGIVAGANGTFSLVFTTTAASSTSAGVYDSGAVWPGPAGINIDITIPAVVTVVPMVASLVGGEMVTVSGSKFFQQGLMVTFSKQSGAVRAASPPPPGMPFANITVAGVLVGQTVTFMTIKWKTEGYYTLTFTNPDGGWVTVYNFYLTGDCPTAGSFGHGSECMPCPKGGICPGGWRVWPMPGYWNTGEGSGFVTQCPDPPERCLGGMYAACGAGYTGAMCGRCADGYYQKGQECVACGDPGVLKALISVDAIFFGLLALCMVVLPDKWLRFVVAAVIVLQTIRAVGQMASSRLPSFLLEVYYYLSLTSFDVSFLRSQCFSSFSTGYPLVFYANLIIVAALVTPTLLLLLLCALVCSKERARFLDRIVRALTIYADLLFLVVATRVCQALYCVSSDGVRMWIDGDTKCFENPGLPVTVIAWILFAGFIVTYPIATAVFVHRLKKKGQLENSRTKARWGYLYYQLTDGRITWFAARFVQLFLLALATAIGSSQWIAQLVLSLLAFAIPLVGIPVLRPFKSIITTVVVMFTAAVGVVIVLINCSAYLNVNASSTVVQSVGLVGFVVIILVLLVMGAVLLRCLLRKRGGQGEPVKSIDGKKDAAPKPGAYSDYEDADPLCQGDSANTARQSGATADADTVASNSYFDDDADTAAAAAKEASAHGTGRKAVAVKKTSASKASPKAAEATPAKVAAKKKAVKSPAKPAAVKGSVAKGTAKVARRKGGMQLALVDENGDIDAMSDDALSGASSPLFDDAAPTATAVAPVAKRAAPPPPASPGNGARATAVTRTPRSPAKASVEVPVKPPSPRATASVTDSASEASDVEKDAA